ncbi:hypothetical protein BJX63DRAFT_438308 [Aspergillus granulosus]|uniref:Uncharacterized protein n=1 Tax=Aspergillus granulosus TaxID=176169 RepID=A0ABR4GSS8_9EURO
MHLYNSSYHQPDPAMQNQTGEYPNLGSDVALAAARPPQLLSYISVDDQKFGPSSSYSYPDAGNTGAWRLAPSEVLGATATATQQQIAMNANTRLTPDASPSFYVGQDTYEPSHVGGHTEYSTPQHNRPYQADSTLLSNSALTSAEASHIYEGCVNSQQGSQTSSILTTPRYARNLFRLSVTYFH